MAPLYIKWSSLALKMNRTNQKQTERPKSEPFFVQFVKPNVSVFGALLYGNHSELSKPIALPLSSPLFKS